MRSGLIKPARVSAYVHVLVGALLSSGSPQSSSSGRELPVSLHSLLNFCRRCLSYFHIKVDLSALHLPVNLEGSSTGVTVPI